MMIRRGFRYRIYPSPEQEARLLQWQGALRALWNAALEQRLYCLDRKMQMPNWVEQKRQLTELRAAEPWIADVPRHAAACVLVALDRAWGRCFAGQARRPHWKKRGRDSIGITDDSVRRPCLDGNRLRFPKLGAVRVVAHRPIRGTAKRCTISQEAGQWFAAVLCEWEVPEPVTREGPTVAIDRGIAHLLADSNGRLVENPRHLERALARLARAHRVVSRRQKGSARRERAKFRVARLHQKVRRQRSHVLHGLSAQYAKSHGVVVLEKLNVQGMVRSRLARQISGASWSMFAGMLRYKLEATGGILVEVPAAYSSQTCAVCSAIDSASRDGEAFRCTSCGHEAQADLNAALILLSRREGGDAGRGGFAEVGQPTKRQSQLYERLTP